MGLFSKEICYAPCGECDSKYANVYYCENRNIFYDFIVSKVYSGNPNYCDTSCVAVCGDEYHNSYNPEEFTIQEDPDFKYIKYISMEDIENKVIPLLMENNNKTVKLEHGFVDIFGAYIYKIPPTSNYIWYKKKINIWYIKVSNCNWTLAKLLNMLPLEKKKEILQYVKGDIQYTKCYL